MLTQNVVFVPSSLLLVPSYLPALLLHHYVQQQGKVFAYSTNLVLRERHLWYVSYFIGEVAWCMTWAETVMWQCAAGFSWLITTT